MRYETLDILRAYAILGVIMYHMVSFFPGGYLGVHIFFVISGYLIARSVSGSDFLGFLLKRFFRIWPVYAVAVLLTCWAGLASGRIDPGWAEQIQLNNLLFIKFTPDWDDLMFTSGVWWSLHAEAWFYAFMALLFYGIRRREVIYAILIILTLISWLHRLHLVQWDMGPWTLCIRNFDCFFYGVVVALLQERIERIERIGHRKQPGLFLLSAPPILPFFV